MLARLAMLVPITMLLASVAGAEEAPEAVRLWQAGQDAMLEGDEERALDCFSCSLAADPTCVRNYLSLSALHLGRGEEDVAGRYMTVYLAARPEAVEVRGHYADLLWRSERWLEARGQYEQFLSGIQNDKSLAFRYALRAHSRLMHIAEELGLGYDEHLHRGIGMLLLSREREALPESNQSSRESLLFQAAAELTLARKRKPDEARPFLYLSEVWSDLVQTQPARRALRAAKERAAMSYLTPIERRKLSAAVYQTEELRRR